MNFYCIDAFAVKFLQVIFNPRPTFLASTNFPFNIAAAAMLPPPLPTRRSPWKKVGLILLLTMALVMGLCGMSIVGLRWMGLIEPFSIPTAAMTPTINRGDQIYAERLTYLLHRPQRGDVVVFRTDGITSLPLHELYVKRLIGLPGDTLTISKGLLCVNGQPAIFHGSTVTMPKFPPLGIRYLADDWSPVTVPEGQCFVMGDNLTNSLDSRYFGCIPTNAVVSHVLLCYLPVNRVGFIH